MNLRIPELHNLQEMNSNLLSKVNKIATKTMIKEACIRQDLMDN